MRKLFRQEKTNRALAAILSAAMVLTSMCSPVLAASEDLFEDVADSEAVVEEVADEIAEEAVLSAEAADDEAQDLFSKAGVGTEEQVDSVSGDSVSNNDSGDNGNGSGVSNNDSGENGNGSGSNNDAGGNGDGDTITISGNETETKPETKEVSEADRATFVYDGVKAEFDTSYKIFSAEYSLGNVKLTYKIPGAKTYAIAKVLFLENGSYVTVLKSKEDAYKSKTYVDKDVTNGFGGGAYVIEAFGDGGSLLGKYITMPTTFIVDASAVSGKGVNVTFAAVGFGATYTIERADNKKFSGATTFTFTEDDLTYCTVANRDCFTFYDNPDKKLTGFGNIKNKYYYRVTASGKCRIGSDTYDLVTKTSKAKGVFGERFAAPIITQIDGTPFHIDGCYAGAILYFTSPEGEVDFPSDSQIKNSSTTIDVYRTDNGAKQYKVTSVKGNVLLRSTVAGRIWYGINLENLQPEHNNSFSIIINREGKKTERSNLYPHYFHFMDVEDLRQEAKNVNTVTLKWTSEQCATKYVIYRTAQGYETAAEAEKTVSEARAYMANFDEAVKTKDLKAIGMKKAKTVTNSETTGVELSADVGKLTAGQYYGFIVVPNNDKAYGYDDSAYTGGYTAVSSPKNITYKANDVGSFKVSWFKVSKATGYLIERIEVADQAELDMMDGTEDWEALYKSKGRYYAEAVSSTTKQIIVTSGTGSDITTAKPGVTYGYRVLTTYDYKGKSAVTEPIKDIFVVGCLGPKFVTNVNVTMLTRKPGGSSNTYWDNAKAYYTLSGNKAGVRSVKVTFTVNDKKNTDHYEVERSDDDGETYKVLGKMVPGAKNEADTYKSGSGTISFYDEALVRGREYTYRIRPVSYEGIPGRWTTADFSVAKSWIMYAKKNSNYNNYTCTTKKTAFPMSSSTTQRIYIDFDPIEPTIDSYTVNCPSFLEYTKGTEELNGYTIHYIDIKAKDGATGEGKLTLKYDRPLDGYNEGASKLITNISMYIRSE